MVSIIVPVYNCEKLLDRCVRSVLEQTYQDLELILVNDGSTDGTAALCDAWASKDSRVKVLHQENAGVSAARNAGLDMAAGEYIGFVDADDYIDEATYETALAAMDGCDLVMWDAVTVWDDGREEADTIDLADGRVLTKKDWSPVLLRSMAGAVWRCLYRSELLADIRFAVGIKLSEDRLFNLQAMGKATAVGYVKKGMYRRVVRPGSAVNRYHGDLMEKSLLAFDLAMQIIDQYWSEAYRQVYTRMFVIDGALAMIRQLCSRDYSGKGRLAAVRQVVRDGQVQAAFSVCPPQSLQEKLLARRLVLGLWAVGMVYRVKNG